MVNYLIGEVNNSVVQGRLSNISSFVSIKEIKNILGHRQVLSFSQRRQHHLNINAIFFSFKFTLQVSLIELQTILN
jgi:hypothetical protein